MKLLPFFCLLSLWLEPSSAQGSDKALLPSVAKRNGTGSWSLLECEVYGYPEPEVHWRDKSGNVLSNKTSRVREKDGRVYAKAELNVTKTGYYTCVATQEFIEHQIENTAFETFQDQPKGNSEVHTLRIALGVVCVLFSSSWLF